jgi:N-hydroxyarylamine O-acetyltransferase
MLAARLKEDILSKLGIEYQPGPDYDGLCRVYHAWCRNVPFDNLCKRIQLVEKTPGPLPGGQADDFFRSWLTHGTGGTCWAGNGALCELLQSLGFDAQRGIATMMVAPDLPPNHGTVSVCIEDRVWLVDASMLHSDPLAMTDDETAIENGAWGVVARHEDARRIVRWKPFFADFTDCRIESLQGSATQFDGYHEATRAWGPFNYAVSVRVIRGERMVGMAFGDYGEVNEQGRRHMAPFEGDERTRFLVDVVGISEEIAQRCPADETMPPPPKR